jgi:hypothetical protein
MRLISRDISGATISRVSRKLLASHLLVALTLKHLRGTITAIRHPLGYQLLSHLLIARQTQTLDVRAIGTPEIGRAIPALTDLL